AVEANKEAFLRCLVLKNLFNLRATFLLGDFVSHLEGSLRYDLIYASGILYHLTDPAEFLVNCASRCDHLFIWSMIVTPEIWSHPYESKWFKKDETSIREVSGV